MKRGTSCTIKGALIIEIKKGNYENGKWTLFCKGKWELCRKRGTCDNKRAFIRGAKGKGHVYKLKRAFVKVNGAPFLCKKGTSYRVKGALSPVKRGSFRVLGKVGEGDCVPSAPPLP